MPHPYGASLEMKPFNVLSCLDYCDVSNLAYGMLSPVAPRRVGQ